MVKNVADVGVNICLVKFGEICRGYKFSKLRSKRNMGMDFLKISFFDGRDLGMTNYQN